MSFKCVHNSTKLQTMNTFHNFAAIKCCRRTHIYKSLCLSFSHTQITYSAVDLHDTSNRRVKIELSFELTSFPDGIVIFLAFSSIHTHTLLCHLSLSLSLLSTFIFRGSESDLWTFSIFYLSAFRSFALVSQSYCFTVYSFSACSFEFML